VAAFYRSSLPRVIVPTTAEIADDAPFPPPSPHRPPSHARKDALVRGGECGSRLQALPPRPDPLAGAGQHQALGSYGQDGAARKRDREEFEGDFGQPVRISSA